MPDMSVEAVHVMAPTLQPIYLLADSQLLFWQRGVRSFIEPLQVAYAERELAAAYIGAANGDMPEFYSMFEAAMANAGITQMRLIRSAFESADQEFLGRSEVIVLAGGDVERGSKVLNETGMSQVLLTRYQQGAVLIGISAGATLLGQYAILEQPDSSLQLIDGLKLLPFIVGAHGEATEWSALTTAIELLEGNARGLGIPAGGGMIYHADGAVQALRSEVHEFLMSAGLLRHSLLLPQSPAAHPEEPTRS